MIREDNWYKMLVISALLHFFILALFSVPTKKPSKKLDIFSPYSVSLVGDIGSSAGLPGSGIVGGRTGRILPHDKKVPEKPVQPSKLKKPAVSKSKDVPLRKEKEAISLSKKKTRTKETAARETPTRDELKRLEEKLKDIRRRTDYLDVAQATKKGASGGSRASGSEMGAYGLPLSSEGGGKPLDPVSQKYILDVWEKIKNAWGLPGASSFKKTLETVVTLKIRRDGRIVDINIEKRSGNRIYDESILRVLRTVDPLPPIPASLNTETVEIGFRFLPGDMS